MSLLQTAQANGLNLEEYLRDLLDSMGTKKYAAEEIRDHLLPYSKNQFKDLKAARKVKAAKEALKARLEKPYKLRMLDKPGQRTQLSAKTALHTSRIL